MAYVCRGCHIRDDAIIALVMLLRHMPRYAYAIPLLSDIRHIAIGGRALRRHCRCRWRVIEELALVIVGATPGYHMNDTLLPLTPILKKTYVMKVGASDTGAIRRWYYYCWRCRYIALKRVTVTTLYVTAL